MLLLSLLFACSEYDVNATPDGAELDDDVIDDGADGDGSDDPVEEDETIDLPIDEAVPTATESIYLNDASNLYTWDPVTNALTPLGAFRDRITGVACDWMVDIAIDLDGRMYGTCGDRLVQIDPTNAEYVIAMTLGVEYVGLTFVADGRLILGGPGDVQRWNPLTGALEPLYTGDQYTTSGDLVGLPDGKLYWSVAGGDDLVTLDPDSGVPTWVGAMGEGWNGHAVWGLAYADGTLFGFTSAGTVIAIDTDTAVATVRAQLSGSWYGATTNPVAW